MKPNLPPVLAKDVDTEAFVAEREKTKHNSMAAVKLHDEDYQYLRETFGTLLDGYDQSKITDVRPKGSKRRYTPRQMYDNAKHYIITTINAAQPLTITGMGLFMGMHRKQIFDMLHQSKLNEYP